MGRFQPGENTVLRTGRTAASAIRLVITMRRVSIGSSPGSEV